MKKKEVKVDKDKAMVKCPQCRKSFNLIWDADYDEISTLIVHYCPSGGLYSVDVICPFCNYEEPL